MSQQVAAQDERPLRADARRNRAKVVLAARKVFSEQGRDAQMDDVARAAGVGVGTVYRHFPTKEALIQALVVDAFESIADEAERALSVEDPWEAFTGVLWHGAGIMAADRTLSEVFQSVPQGQAGAPATMQRLLTAAAELVRRAQAAGVLREDVVVDDIPMVMCGIGSATRKEHCCRQSWRRHLSIVLDGLRATSASDRLPS
jgi:AcrR family transcriptional regulator